MEFFTGDIVETTYDKNKGKGKIIGRDIDKYTYQLCVEFNKNISGHDGNSIRDTDTGKNVKGKDGHCWWYTSDYLKLVRRYNKNKRIGD